MLVISGKETVLEISLEEDLRLLQEVVITGNENQQTANDGAIASARAFTPEDVNRYAGGRSDPARLAANFARSAPDDSRNDIVIRGNSPVGVLWRMNGMNVTNPNHFASIGTTGGAVNAINTNILKSSDFLTSAFPAEYGNATSGVFDLGFRNGNAHARETTLQIGVITGVEATTEGPILQENGSSYIVGYRYALAGIAQKAGIDIGTTATPSYQDLSWNINSGNNSFGRVSLFGIVASSSINIAGGNSSSLYGGGSGHDLGSTIDIIGVNYFKQLDNTSFLTSTFGGNYSASSQTDYGYDRRTNTEYAREENEVTRSGRSLALSYNAKVHPRLFVKAGIQDELIGVNLYSRTKDRIEADWRQIWDEDGTTNLFQSYLHAKYSMRDDLSLTAGAHAQTLSLNNAFSVEPRLGLKWDWTPASSLTFAYGLHSQMQPINVYYLQTQHADASYSSTNANLGFTKSHHLVLGYELLPFADWHLKTEVYYQSLYNVPITTSSSAYSMLNTGASFRPDLEDSLVNNGTGRNYGVECTVEKYFSSGYYGLCTASLYDALYTASDGVERNTAFNGRYVVNLLLGKEWTLEGTS
ncbi:MAG: TonB-dependent receptor plug domain-containing protein [Ignavibacteria bacterium]|nr:TonB-dependent receptor plug domain-containing protein [Ignavibacteria bacterium]